ncbi:odorant receptor 4 [Leptinotarsa decemlineata]|uniref:odorant receptor 4 n=1 Tax=Leptinotarsa decemlineata TaxID=7539 RepID=UPI003D30BFE3
MSQRRKVDKHTYIKTDLDIALIVSIAGCYYFNSCFVAKIKNTLKLCRILSDFRTYGKPKDFDKENKKLNYFSVVYQIFGIMAMLAIIVTPLMDKGRCEKENIRRNLDEVCGIMGAAWWPFDFGRFPYKQLYYAYQMYSVSLIYYATSTTSFTIVESTEHLILRFKHVRLLFLEALQCENPTHRKEFFNRTVRYHNEVMNMAIIYNNSFRVCVFMNLFFSAIVLGCLSYAVFENFSLGGLCLYILWATSVAIVCHSGQRLINESTGIGETIYNAKWYNFENNLQKELLMVMMRSEKPVYLEAGPFGNMTHGVLMTIQQTSYSYLSLLRGTSGRE